MAIWISRQLWVFNFNLLDMWCAWIEHPSEKLWQFDFSESFRFSISSVSIYYAPESDLRLIVMTIWISQGLPLFKFERLHILCSWIGLPWEKLWPFEFLKTFRCSILSVLKCDAPESDLQVKSYDHLNFSRRSIVQFRVSRNVMRLNRTSEW